MKSVEKLRNQVYSSFASVTLAILVLTLFALPARAQTYTSDTNIAHFTAEISTYATFSNYSTTTGCTTSTFTPTSAELTATSCRVFGGTLTGAGLSTSFPDTQPNNWILATFSIPVKTIVVFPNIDHFGSPYDGFQYQIAGSNDGVNWTQLYDATSVGGAVEPFTLGSFSGTAPTAVNNVLTDHSSPAPAGCSIPNPPECQVGYIATFNFGTAYQYYAFGASTVADAQGNRDQELSAVGTTLPRGTVSISAAAQSGSNTTYTYSLVNGPDLQTGESIVVSGMPAGSNDNGTFLITGVASGAFTVVNAAGMNAPAAAGTGTVIFGPKSGALLTIVGTAGASPVNISIYDSQIHSGTVQTVPVGSGLSNCNANDAVPTDANALMGGSTTGCDAGDAFEVTESNNPNAGHQKPGLADVTLTGATGPAGSGFHIETHYLCGATGASAANPTVCAGGITSTTPACNTSGTLCASPDSGFVTVKNNTGSAFTGTITLQGTSPTAGGVCPTGGTASDSSSTGLGAGALVTLGLGTPKPDPGTADSSSCGGFDWVQTQTLTQGNTSTFPFGNEAFKFSPFLGGTGDTLKFRPVPVPAGPLSAGKYGNNPAGGVTPPASPLRFGQSANFPSQNCIALADFSGPLNPVCAELEFQCFSGNVLDGGDCLNIFYNNELDFIKDTSLSGGIGGVEFIKRPMSTCPPTLDFTENIFLFYTATVPDPIGGGGRGTNCDVATFDPNATAIAAGATQTEKTFVGFQNPIVNCSSKPCVPNLIQPGQGVPWKWQSFSDSAGTVPITDLNLCTDSTGTNCTGHWVFAGTTAISCNTDASLSNNITADTPAGQSGLQFDPLTNTYTLVWKTSKSSTGCVSTVMGFFTGQWFLDTADFRFKH